MKHPSVLAITGLALILSLVSPAFAQEESAQPPAPMESTETSSPGQDRFVNLLQTIQWTTEGKGEIGGMATLEVPQGFRMTGADGTQKLMQEYGNIVSGQELAYFSPDDLSWFALFEFNDVGYVKDDEKDKLDADKILDELKKGQAEANKELTKRGMATLEVLGWKKPPFYNAETHNLEWAIRLHSSTGGDVLNYKTKILGRHGVMDVVLVCGEEQLETVLPVYQKALTGFAFKKENSYASFVKGDRVAEYGLTGLIVGGGLLAAAKSGLLAKLWKPIAFGLVAIGAFFKRLFTGRTGQTKDSL